MRFVLIGMAYSVFLVKQHIKDIYTVAYALYRIILELLKNSMMI